MMSLYQQVEMNNIAATSIMQAVGVPINTSFYAQVFNEVNDRQRMIEYYVTTFEGGSFNPLSSDDVESLKHRLQQRPDDIHYNLPLLLNLIDEYHSLDKVLSICSSVLPAEIDANRLLVVSSRAPTTPLQVV